MKNTEEANAELERMEAVEEEEEEERRKPESLVAGNRILLPAPRSTNTERAVSPFEVYNPFESDEDEEQKSKKEFDPFDLPTTSESD